MRVNGPARGRQLDEKGAVAIMVALALTTLVVIAAMVLDFGLVRVDRQVDKSAADSAALAGAQSLGLNGSDTSHPFAGVCAALRYLQANSPRFSAIPTSPSTGWSDGNGTATGNGCDPATGLRNKSCVPGNASSWARYVWDSTWQGTELKVTIQSGYQLPAAGWTEDQLPAAQNFSDDKAQGCDQISVIILEQRQPGLGSVATSSQLTSSIRSVARVESRPGSDAPAMLLLRRTGCPILQTGSNAGTSHVYVYGAMASDGSTQAGTIHADSTGASCSGGSNQNIFLGKGTNGIVSFAAPQAMSYSAYQTCVQASNCAADATKPGTITSVASANGQPTNVISDGLSNVFGSGAANPGGIGTATKAAPSGRSLVTRTLVDNRYLGSNGSGEGIWGIVNQATPIWGYTSAPAGWSKFPSTVDPCKPTQADVTALSLGPSSKLFVNCTSQPNGFVGNGNVTIPAGTVVFNGPVSPSATVSLPNATKVYIVGYSGSNKAAINLSTGGTLSIHTNNTSSTPTTSSNIDSTTALCSNHQTDSDNKAVVVVKGGAFKQSGTSTLQLCYTTVVMEGSGSNACLTNVPSEEDPLTGGPTSTPCTTGAGDGQLSQSGGGVDWTAPNSLDIINKDANGNPDLVAQDAWLDVNGPEDLAFWSESYGGSSNPTYSMGGGSLLHVVGVYMLPNAQPFTINGGATQTLVNAQYVASSIDLNGANTQISMRVDPNSAVTTPEQGLVGLVR